MNELNLRVAVSGASGRMGQQLIKSLLSQVYNSRSVILTGAITHSTSKFIGYDVGRLIGSEVIGIRMSDSIEDISSDFDVLIDFSNAQATLKYLEFCNIHNKNMVIGTTGFKEEEVQCIQNISKNIGIVFSPNFSIMMNLMFKLLKKTAHVIGHSSDTEIIDMHHCSKSDIPSGTALQIQKIIKSSLLISNSDIKNDNFFLKHLRCPRDVKMHSIRAGDSIGEHSVFFFGMGERLEITHRAFDRVIFANGAICSAIWLGKVKTGLFDMSDVLELDDI